jgi:hypothetical protein
MSFEDWQKENQDPAFLRWTQENSNQTTPTNLTPEQAGEDAGTIYDDSIKTNIPYQESERLFYATKPPEPQTSPGILKRWGSQFYNATIANTFRVVANESRMGKIGTDFKTIGGLKQDFLRRVQAGEPVTEKEVRFHTAPYKKGSFGSVFGSKRPEEEQEIWGRYERGELNIVDTKSPEKELERFADIQKVAIAERAAETEIGVYVPPPEGVIEKLTDATAGIVGYMAQIAMMKRLAPSMPDWLIWENVNLVNGGEPGRGAAMQLTLGGLQKAIPGTGFTPAIKRGATSSTLFGASTYFGGGDTVDVLISMGIPFAFEGIGMTKQSWVNYKNKGDLINSLKQKAPALNNRPNVEIEAAVSKLLPNVTQQPPKPTPKAKGAKPKLRTAKEMKAEFQAKKPAPEISTEVRAYLQRQQYDKLLEKANSGDKKAIKQLNDYVQGRNIPTYEQLLERAYNGDATAIENIQLGNYQGGEGAVVELAVPKPQKPAGAAYKPPSRIQQIRELDYVFKNDAKPGKLSATESKKARERGFVTSVKEVVPELKIEGQYIPRATDPLAIKAKNLIKDNILKAESVAMKGNNDKAVAVASELIKHYNNLASTAKTPAAKEAALAKVTTITNEVAHKLTEAGRTTQAAVILGRLTPEGQLRFAASEIQRYNRNIASKRGGIGGLRKQIPELTTKQANRILTEMKAIQEMPEGKAKFMRFQKLQTEISNMIPTPLWKKITTTWRAGLLTGIKTSGLNIFSNISHTGTEIIKDIPATAVDKVASYFTGKRTVTPNVKGLGKGNIEGFKKGVDYLKTGYSERDIGTKLDYKQVNMGKGRVAQALQKYTDGIFRVLGAEDQPFYYAAKMRSMYEQAKVSAINNKLTGKAAQKHINELMNNPTERMIRYASMDAETAVYINQTKLGDVARGIQKLPGGEVVVPFSRTPSAVAMQIVNYSPAGAVKTIVQNIGKGRFDQRTFSQGMGRSITGTAALYIGTKLFEADLITLDRPNTEKERKLWEIEGRTPNSIKINGKWRTVQSFGPAGNLLIVGGHFKRAFEESGSPTEAMSEATLGSAKSFTEQTFLRGVNQFVSALADPERNATYVAGQTASTIIPTIVSDVARATDPLDRRAETTPQKLMSRIPGARQMLEPRVTVLGEEKAATANPIELMIDPTRPSKDVDKPVVKELRRLWDAGWEVSPNQLGTRFGYEILTPQENTKMWKIAGDLTSQGLTQLVESPDYKGKEDIKKAETIEEIINIAQDGAKLAIITEVLNKTKPEDKQKVIFEMRKQGLATAEIIPIALSKQNPRAVRAKESRGK